MIFWVGQAICDLGDLWCRWLGMKWTGRFITEYLHGCVQQIDEDDLLVVKSGIPNLQKHWKLHYSVPPTLSLHISPCQIILYLWQQERIYWFQNETSIVKYINNKENTSLSVV